MTKKTQTYADFQQMLPLPAKLVLKYDDEEIVGADGIPVTVTVVHPRSRKFYDASAALNKSIQEAPEEADIDYVTSCRAHFVSAVLFGWSHDDFFGKFSKERAYELLNNYERSDFLTQIEQFAAERANFLKK